MRCETAVGATASALSGQERATSPTRKLQTRDHAVWEGGMHTWVLAGGCGRPRGGRAGKGTGSLFKRAPTLRPSDRCYSCHSSVFCSPATEALPGEAQAAASLRRGSPTGRTNSQSCHCHPRANPRASQPVEDSGCSVSCQLCTAEGLTERWHLRWLAACLLRSGHEGDCIRLPASACTQLHAPTHPPTYPVV